MSLSLRWLGHSAFVLDFDGHTALIDPFLTDNPLAAAAPDALQPEIIFLSHGHGDHLGDTVAIAQQSGALVVTNVEIARWLNTQGVANTSGQNTGGGADYGFVHCRFTLAHHSSSLPDGSYGGNPHGFILTGQHGERVYFAGDTDLFTDMQLIGDYRIDVAFLPIGDHFTMGPSEALRAINYIRPRYVVPMHYNTFPPIVVDVAGWAHRVSSETNAMPVVLDPGGTFTLPNDR